MIRILFYNILICFSFMFVFSATKLFACSCLFVETIKDAYKVADAVVLGKIEKVESNEREVNSKKIWSSQETTVSVLKPYKNVRSKKVKLHEINTSCSPDFKGDEGKTYLFYLDFDKEDNTYSVRECGRSSPLINVVDDLSWLNKLPNSLKRTRVSGTISLYDWGWEVKFIRNVSGIKVKLFNQKKSYETVTDKNGMYEFWDVPKGRYKLKALIPSKYKLQNQDRRGNFEYRRIDENTFDLENFTFRIVPHNSIGIDFTLTKAN